MLKANNMDKKKPGRPKIMDGATVSVYIASKYLFKMREMNRSFLINSLLEKYFNEEEKGTVQPNN